jgi:hypothetical protein
MLTHPQPAVYKCVTLVQRPLAASSTVYHSLFSGEGTQEIIYPAWPDIDDPDNSCCLPFLLRAVYFLDLDVAVTLEETIAIAEEYVSRPEIMAGMAPEVHQQMLALINAFQRLAKHSIQMKALSPGVEYVRKGQPPSVARNAMIEFTRSFMSNHTAQQAVMPGVRGLLYGFLGDFPGTMYGDFSYAFSYCHEMGHRIARFTHSGIVQDGLAERTHKILYTLATKGFLVNG